MAEGGLRLRVEGRVQGVGFRWYIREAARQLGVSGTVRNLADGAVEIEAAGPADALAALERAAREGPPGSAVSHVRAAPLGDDRALPFPFTVHR